MDRTKRSEKNRAQVRQEVRDQVREWYVLCSTTNPEEGIEVEECEYTDAYGITDWWLEPLIKGVDNPIVREAPVGNSDWKIEIVKRPEIIRSFGNGSKT